MRKSKKKPSDFLHDLPPLPEVNFEVKINRSVFFFSNYSHVLYLLEISVNKMVGEVHIFFSSSVTIAHTSKLHFRYSIAEHHYLWPCIDINVYY